MEMQTQQEQSTSSAEERIGRLILAMEQVIKGKRQQIELVITTMLAKGHILMEDNPGTGKTVLARTLAHCVSGYGADGSVIFKRVQFTPDLLPMDLIGSHLFDEKNADFVFKKGPLFCNILLADEINRASPKVQSALLECMAEGQITVGDTTTRLEDFFFTIATQNPVEMEGTYPLPAAQLDRFFMKIYFGYVDEATEADIYRNYLQIGNNLHQIEQVLSMEDVLALQKEADGVFIHEEIIQAVNHIVRDTRQHPDITLGASTRAGIAFIRCLKAFALVKGRSFVIEDDVQAIAKAVLDHRLVYRNREAKQKAFDQLLMKEMQRLSKLKIYG
jgi:MoxR-like ATPase